MYASYGPYCIFEHKEKIFFFKSIYAVYTKHDKTVPVLIHFIDEPR